MSSARKSLGRPSPSVAPAARRACSRRVEIGLVATGQLHLDLPEALDRARPAQHLHGVEHDLGDGPARVADQHALASRPQRGHGHQRGAARPDGDEVDHPWRWGVGPGAPLAGAAPTGPICVSGQLELESRFALGQLELPQALAALDAAAEGDTRHRQPMVRRVQVDVGEGARGQRLSRQMGEPKPRPGAELQLALERGRHLPGRTRVAHGHGQQVLPRREGGEQLTVARVAEKVRGGGNAKPSDGVDLVARLGVAVGRHGPVANDLRTPARVAVGDRRQLRTRHAAQAGLLPHLAERTLLVRLACLHFALGEGPIPVLGTMDQQHLDLADLVAPRDHAARRPHHAILRHVGDLGLRVCARARAAVQMELSPATADRFLADHAADGQTRSHPSAIGGRPRPTGT